MPQIKILPEILSNKIAAGEVVERPASVVKELVENALDAGSTRVMIDVEKGGRSLIRVSDNGIGMGHDDALLALERYATSKIYKDHDLFSIHTLGFRGEALPSIASVSRLTLVSRDVSADAGTEIVVDGGKIKKVSEIGAPAGTMATVRQLFFNTPARRKFLKTIGTEMGHIADRVSSFALGHPDVQFRLTHNDKIVKNWPITSAPFDRIVDVIGSDLKNELHAMEFQSSGISITGWISTPRATRRTSRAVYIYVNGRLVRDRIVQHALFEGYSQRLVKGQFPVAVIFIDVPFDEVDVNVHPTKNEVRFARQRDVHEAVRRAVAQTLYEVDIPGWGPAKSSENSRAPVPARVSETKIKEFGLRPEGAYAPEGSRNAEVGKKELEFGIRPPGRGGLRPGGISTSGPEGPPPRREVGFKKADDRSQSYSSHGDTRHEFFDEASTRSSHPAPRTPYPAPRDSQRATQIPPPANRITQAPIWQKKGFGDMRIIGQIYNTYIVCEAQEGLILIDQHAAHERILFERFSARSDDPQHPAQRLLVPETIELGYREAGVLDKLIPELSALGLDIEPFGGNTFVIKAVPVLLADQKIKPLVFEIVEKMVEIGSAPGLAEALDKCRMVMACHGAIRANKALSYPQIKGLLNQLDACHNPSHCPHGRPTWICWDIANLEKSFKRIV
jgi:DNA mismatch repair protein MutL